MKVVLGLDSIRPWTPVPLTPLSKKGSLTRYQQHRRAAQAAETQPRQSSRAASPERSTAGDHPELAGEWARVHEVVDGIATPGGGSDLLQGVVQRLAAKAGVIAEREKSEQAAAAAAEATAA